MMTTEPSNEQVVRQKYPTAKCIPNPHEEHSEGLNFAIVHKEWMGLSSWVSTEAEAWADARSRLPMDEVVKTNTLGEEKSEPLTDNQLRMICNGLLVPNQSAAKAMAYELRKWRGDPNPDLV